MRRLRRRRLRLVGLLVGVDAVGVERHALAVRGHLVRLVVVLVAVRLIVTVHVIVVGLEVLRVLLVVWVLLIAASATTRVLVAVVNRRLARDPIAIVVTILTTITTAAAAASSSSSSSSSLYGWLPSRQVVAHLAGGRI